MTDGGLVSYGTDLVDQYRRAAGYVDRILKVAATMSVQSPIEYDLTINLKTSPKRSAWTGMTATSARADEVIE